MRREVVIIGGGPAGLSAAIELAETGAQVLLIDENRQPGGQLFKPECITQVSGVWISARSS